MKNKKLFNTNSINFTECPKIVPLRISRKEWSYFLKPLLNSKLEPIYPRPFEDSILSQITKKLQARQFLKLLSELL